MHAGRCGVTDKSTIQGRRVKDTSRVGAAVQTGKVDIVVRRVPEAFVGIAPGLRASIQPVGSHYARFAKVVSRGRHVVGLPRDEYAFS